MSIISITPKEIELPKSMLDMLNGNSMFWLENPYFQVPLNRFKLNKNICKSLNSTISGNKKLIGNRFITPRLLIKHNGKFTQYFNIHYTENNKLMKTFNVRKPYLTEPDIDKNKYKFDITFIPKFKDKYELVLEEEDDIMLRFDQLYTMTLELVLACGFIGFKITDEKSDREIIENMCKYIEQPDAIKYLSEEYFSYINRYPIYIKNEDKYYINSIVEDNDYSNNEVNDNVYDIFSLLRKIMKKNKKLSKLPSEIKTTISKNNCVLVPSFKMVRYNLPAEKIKEGQSKYGFVIEVPFKFYIQNTTTPATFPSFLYTKTPKKNIKHRNDIMNYEELRNLYTGNKPYQEAPRVSGYDCHLFITPTTEFALYQAGQPKTSWRVDSIISKRLIKENIDIDYIKNDYFEESESDDDDDENEPNETDLIGDLQ